MLGNSIKSDILPVLIWEAYAAHIPYHITWAHEQHQSTLAAQKFHGIGKNRSGIGVFGLAFKEHRLFPTIQQCKTLRN